MYARNKDVVFAEIVSDSDSDMEVGIEHKLAQSEIIGANEPQKVTKQKQAVNKWLNTDLNIIEVGVDEVGRGPLFGRVYAAAVILPKGEDSNFDYASMKDSKKFHSKKKIEEVACYIKEHAIALHVSYCSETIIDQINILQATQKAMHDAIKNVLAKYIIKQKVSISSISPNVLLMVDGNYFNPYTTYDASSCELNSIPHVTVEGGDNKYACIAAASILAKVERDAYIAELCEEHPELKSRYGIDTNKGYGAKKHMDGIKTHGITVWHRKSFAPCKHYV